MPIPSARRPLNIHQLTADRALAFKSDSKPAIAYALGDRDGGGLHGVQYTEFNGSSWSIDAVDGSVSGLLSLALDSSNQPWIGFSDQRLWPTNMRYRVGHRAGGTWTVWTVQDQASNANEQSIAIDSNGVPVAAWLAYANSVFTGEGRLSRYNGSQWVPDSVPFALNARDTAALAFDRQTGRPVVAYTGLDNGLWLASETQFGWTQQQISNSCAGGISVEFAPSGELAILEGNRYWTPEPATIVMLALAGVGVLRRKSA